MKAEIVKQTKDLVVINWEDDEKGHGQISISYNNDGSYSIDAEFISINTIIQIIKAIKSLKPTKNFTRTT